MTLFRMLAILLAIDQVIHHIDAGSQQAERSKRQQYLDETLRILPGMTEQQADEDKAIFQPLMWPHQADERFHL